MTHGQQLCGPISAGLAACEPHLSLHHLARGGLLCRAITNAA
jgi:hypothetical protein